MDEIEFKHYTIYKEVKVDKGKEVGVTKNVAPPPSPYQPCHLLAIPYNLIIESKVILKLS